MRLRNGLERLLELVTIGLIATLTLVVVLAVTYRKLGASLVWYDEVASIMLAWLTYYGAALAALKRAHIGFPGLIEALGPAARLPLALVAEAVIIGFFVLLAWIGWEVLEALDTDYLVSLPEVSTQYTQSVIPIGAALFVLAELLVLPEVLREARRGGSAEATAR
jgi:TRAP-type C4-dicarboxylate transport system permease small subunit